MMPQRLYLDTAPVIYVIEDVAEYSDAVQEHLAYQDTVLVVSDLTRLECRVKPIREQDNFLLLDYDSFFFEACDEVVALSSEVIDMATQIRAEYGFKTPDAIHLAAASLSRCDVFLTNDNALKRYPDLDITVLDK